MSKLTHGHAAGRTARALFEQLGPRSVAEAAERAEERFANIDVGGFAFWKLVERELNATRRITIG